MTRETLGAIGIIAGLVLIVGAAGGIFVAINIVIGAGLLVAGAAILKVRSHL